MTRLSERVYLVIAEAVYDHGVLFATHSREAAEAFCEEYAPDGDGHHDWRIDEIDLGVPGKARRLDGGEDPETGVTLTKKADR